MSVGRFGQSLLFLPFRAKLGIQYLHGARDVARKEVLTLVAYNQGAISWGFRICSLGLAGVMQLTVRATLAKFPFLADFRPVA